jgi:lipopolysaccharide transport protein LptA
MDGSLHKFASLAAALAISGPMSAQNAGEPLPIDLDFASLSIDGETNRLHIRAPRIAQGDELRIQANEAFASETGFESAEWELSGGVRVETPTLVIDADRAVFTFQDFMLTRSALEGHPASFTDRGGGGRQPATGTAAALSYDHAKRVLRLQGNVRLERGTSVLVSCDLIYDFGDKGRIATGTADCPEQSQFRFIPRAGNATTDADP